MFRPSRIYVRVALGGLLCCSGASSAYNSSDYSHDLRRYKYVVIGAGASGRAAIQEIAQDDSPDFNMLVVDRIKQRHVTSTARSHIEHTDKEIAHINIPQHSISFTDGETVAYNKCLIAIGRNFGFQERHSLVDDECRTKVMCVGDNGAITRAVEIVQSGGHVTLLGGSWTGVALASYLTVEARRKGYVGAVTLIAPSTGLLNDILPHYLSRAVEQRLKSSGVEVVTYTQVRYVGNSDTLHSYALPSLSPTNVETNGLDREWKECLGIHCAATHDTLRTSMFATDAVLLCTECGNTAPKLSSSTPGQSSGALSLSSGNAFVFNSGLEIDQFGCVVANPSLLAAQDVYVAGDIASAPSALGRGFSVGLLGALSSGIAAGRNMRLDGSVDATTNPTVTNSFIPTYHGTVPALGMNIRLIGDCSNTYMTYGFWWKDPECQSRTLSRSNEKFTYETHHGGYPKSILDMSRTYGKLLSRALPEPDPPKEGQASDLLGIGVVFYINSDAVISGVAVCGSGPEEHSSNINRLLDVYSQAELLIGKKTASLESSGNDDKGKRIVGMLNTGNVSGETSASMRRSLQETACQMYERIYPDEMTSAPTPRLRFTAPSRSKMMREVRSGKGNRLPWRFSIHSSLETENIFYRKT